MTIYLRENDNCYLRRSWSNIATCEMVKQGHNYYTIVIIIYVAM